LKIENIFDKQQIIAIELLPIYLPKIRKNKGSSEALTIKLGAVSILSVEPPKSNDIQSSLCFILAPSTKREFIERPISMRGVMLPIISMITIIILNTLTFLLLWFKLLKALMVNKNNSNKAGMDAHMLA